MISSLDSIFILNEMLVYFPDLDGFSIKSTSGSMDLNSSTLVVGTINLKG